MISASAEDVRWKPSSDSRTIVSVSLSVSCTELPYQIHPDSGFHLHVASDSDANLDLLSLVGNGDRCESLY